MLEVFGACLWLGCTSFGGPVAHLSYYRTDAGVVIGVWTHLADSLPGFVDSIKAMLDAEGIDHVGIGTDTDLLSSRVGQGTNKAWPGLTGGFFPAVVGEMQRQSFTPDDIGKVAGGNFCRIFGKVTAGHS